MSIEAHAICSPAFSKALGLPDGSPAPKDLTADELGDFSEIKVATALMNHPDIAKVIKTEHYSPDDMRGRDIIIQFNNDLNRDNVYIQVKSSQSGADIYNKRTAKWLKKHDMNMTPRQWMTMNRTVLIIGNGHTHDEIRDSFNIQLENIIKLQEDNQIKN